MIAQIVWCVLLFRHPGCLKMRKQKINLVGLGGGPIINIIEDSI